MIGAGIVTKLGSIITPRGIVVALCLLVVLGSLYVHSSEVSSSYKQGYRTAQLEYEAAQAKKLAQAVQSARAERALAEKSVQGVQEATNEVQSTASAARTTCPDVGTDVLRMLNSPIQAGNSGMRVHKVP